MTPLANMGALARRSLVATLALGAVTVAQAQVQWSTGQVLIDFDPGSFWFTSDTTYGGTVGVSPSYSQVGQGVELNFGGSAAAYASSYQYYSPDGRSAPFSAFIGFTPEAGYAITGYTVTYVGGYSIESPATVTLVGHAGTLVSSSSGSSGFSFDVYQSGSTAPNITGELSAWANVDYLQIFDGYEQVYSHDEQVLDYCEVDDPSICYYHYEPVYIDQPVYHYESDLGEGQIYLTSITVRADVAAVPEPGVVAMTLAGLAAVGWCAARRRRAV
ncbi:MAG: PEP-CTERM sorting domain-containing protein [Rubrivivax sp.]|nr:MAG: PEP-CTERM sorting domain-containing protein [Rubrivivax sp.]